MSTIDYYAILGVSPAASQDEIRSAHRQLVKRFHPDIYTTGGDKARATEKLRDINEAYAVLGNAARRKQYDAGRIEHPRGFKNAPLGRARPRPAARKTPTQRAQRNGKKFVGKWRFFGARRLAFLVVAVSAVGLLTYAIDSQTRLIPIWVLLHKTEIEPLQSESNEEKAIPAWNRIGIFSTRAECAAGLKLRVRRDEHAGGRAIVDEGGGTVGITVFIETGHEADGDNGLRTDRAGAGNPKTSDPPATNEAKARRAIKRIHHYECRGSRIREAESWLRRLLRKAGFFS